MKPHIKFALIADDGYETRTFEDYDTPEQVLYAYYHIMQTSKHVPQNGGGELIDVPPATEWSIDVEVWDIESNTCTFEPIDKYIKYLN